MKTKNLLLKSLIATGFISMLTSCSKSDSGSNVVVENSDKFFISAVTGSTNYLLTTTNPTSGNLTTTGNGAELLRTYTWLFHGNDRAMGLIYQQGNPAPGLAYKLDGSGNLVKSGYDFEVPNGYTTYGQFENYIVTAATGRSATDTTLAVFSFYDVMNSNVVTVKTTQAHRYAGTDLKAVFSGLLDMGDGTFMTGVVLSDRATTSTSGIGTITYPDSCYAARLDGNLNLINFYRDGRLSFSSGRYRSAVYSQIGKDDNDNIYVFSGAYESSTTKKAGVIRINKGATTFDESYYFDIQSAANNHKFKRLWHISGSSFMLEFYNQSGNITNTLQGSTSYGIVNAESKTFNWLTSANGMPDSSTIIATGTPTAYNGKLYMPLTVQNQNPAIYVIDPADNTTKKGVEVQADAINAIGFLKRDN